MKSKKFISAAVAVTLAFGAVIAQSAFAYDEPPAPDADADVVVLDQDPNNRSGNTSVEFDVAPRYSVTIPAKVTLSETAETEAEISASDIILDDQQVNVTLSAATNTAAGSSSFSAKRKTSTASYTISVNDTTVAVGDTVAEFEEDGTQKLIFSKATGATLSGSHSEQLTFTISVSDIEP